MLPNLTIFQKGIALGIGLLVLEFAALLALLMQAQNANALNDDLAEMTQIYVHTQGLMSTLYNSRESMTGWVQGTDPKGLDHFYRLADASDADFKFMAEKRKVFESQSDFNRDLSAKILLIENRVKEWVGKVDINVRQLNAMTPEQRALVKNMNPDVTLVRLAVQQELVALARRLQNNLSAISVAELNNYKHMQSISIAAVVGNVVICILMGVFLGRDLVSRLRV
ncbi:MAG: hypothetical protein K2Z81_08190, partial [Cyanobacteria bacterium]|nr:hypothetical protein [Cyanobacteriota bacterium]